MNARIPGKITVFSIDFLPHMEYNKESIRGS